MWTKKNAATLTLAREAYFKTPTAFSGKPPKTMRVDKFLEFVSTYVSEAFAEKLLQELDVIRSGTSGFHHAGTYVVSLADYDMCHLCGVHAVGPQSKLVCAICGATDKGNAYTRQVNIDNMKRTWETDYDRLMAHQVKASRAKYGTDFPWQSAKVQAKKRKNEKARGGHHFHDPKILLKQQKAAFRIKTVKINGKTFQCQGYEPFMLAQVAHKYPVSQMLTPFEDGFVPIELDNGTCFHPDIWIKKVDRYVEVKSDYVLLANGQNGWAKNVYKAKCCHEANIDVRWIVAYPDKDIYVPLPADWYTWTKREVREYLSSATA